MTVGILGAMSWHRRTIQRSVLRAFARVLALTLLTVFTLAGDAQAGPDPFTSRWDAADGFFPDEVTPAWSATDSAEPEDPAIDGGVLRIETSANAENVYYLQAAPTLDITPPFSLVARLRFVSGSSSASNRATGFIGVTTMPFTGVALFIEQDRIFLTAAGDVRGDSAEVDTDDDFHDYRIDIAEDGTTTVRYDGVVTLTGATWSSNTNHGPDDRVFWGEGSILAFGVLEWETMRHTALFPVVTTTVTTTSTTSTTLPLGICGDANEDTMIAATDALIILQKAVGQPLVCLPERCDVDSSGSIVASDALRVLQSAVGLDVPLICPAPA